MNVTIEDALDCHPGDGVSFCGWCVSCLSRVNAHLHAENKRLLSELEACRVARDAWAIQCNMASEAQADALNDALKARSEASDAMARAESAELGCEIAYRREPTPAEGEAYKFDRGEGAIVESHVPMGNWHGHRCTCGKWVWGGGTVCQGCVDAQAVRTAIERLKAEEQQANKYADECTEAARVLAVTLEELRLTKIRLESMTTARDSARSQGELDFVTMRRQRDEATKQANLACVRFARVADILRANGCDCDCGCDSDGHGDSCEVCLGCRIERAMRGEL